MSISGEGNFELWKTYTLKTLSVFKVPNSAQHYWTPILLSVTEVIKGYTMNKINMKNINMRYYLLVQRMVLKAYDVDTDNSHR